MLSKLEATALGGLTGGILGTVGSFNLYKAIKESYNLSASLKQQSKTEEEKSATRYFLNTKNLAQAVGHAGMGYWAASNYLEGDYALPLIMGATNAIAFFLQRRTERANGSPSFYQYLRKKFIEQYEATL